MAKTNDLVEIEGFDRLNAKLKQLDDRVKRKEVLKIFRKIVKPTVDAYKSALPVGTRDKTRNGTVYKKGMLSKHVKVQTVPATKVGGNPSIVVRVQRKGKHIVPYYGFMVTRKGAMTGMQIKKGASRKGKNTVVEEARDKAARATVPQAQAKAEQQTAKLIQKQIDSLS